MQDRTGGQDAARARQKALVVDDDEAGRVVLRVMLENLGLDVATAASAADAIDAFRPGAFAIVFLDIHMPGVRGEYVLQHIRSADGPERSPTPVMAYTADVAKPAVERLARLGFDGCLSKPVDLTTLHALVRGAVDVGE